jgi:hypothetical protein
MGLAATLGLSALFMGPLGASKASADDWERYGRSHIYRDIADVRRDERILRRLQDEHDEARRCKDWPRMHALDRRIADLRRHIDEDRRDIRHDINRDRYQSSDRYRNDNYRNGSYRDSGYRYDSSRYDRDGRYRVRDDR